MNDIARIEDHYLTWQTALDVFKSAKQAKVPERDLRRLGDLAYRCYLIYLGNDKDYVRSLIAELGYTRSR